EAKARISWASGRLVRRLPMPIRRISGRASTEAMTYCQKAMPVELMPKPPYSAGVGSTDCSTLEPAKAMAAVTIRIAPVVAPLWEAEETWLIDRPFRNQFPQGYGKSRRQPGRTWNRADADKPALVPFSFIRTIPSAPELHRIC